MQKSNVSPPETQTFTAHVRVSATVIEEKDGVVVLGIEARDLSDAERLMIGRLFPHLSDQAHELLIKEALISAMVD